MTWLSINYQELFLSFYEFPSQNLFAGKMEDSNLKEFIHAANYTRFILFYFLQNNTTNNNKTIRAII